MKIIGFLKKIGLLRSGAASWKGSAKDVITDADGIPVSTKQDNPENEPEPQESGPASD